MSVLSGIDKRFENLFLLLFSIRIFLLKKYKIKLNMNSFFNLLLVGKLLHKNIYYFREGKSILNIIINYNFRINE